MKCQAFGPADYRADDKKPWGCAMYSFCPGTHMGKTFFFSQTFFVRTVPQFPELLEKVIRSLVFPQKRTSTEQNRNASDFCHCMRVFCLRSTSESVSSHLCCRPMLWPRHSPWYEWTGLEEPSENGVHRRRRVRLREGREWMPAPTGYFIFSCWHGIWLERRSFFSLCTHPPTHTHNNCVLFMANSKRANFFFSWISSRLNETRKLRPCLCSSIFFIVEGCASVLNKFADSDVLSGNPCWAIGDGTCTMKRRDNRNLKDIIHNELNVTCQCSKLLPGYKYYNPVQGCVGEYLFCASWDWTKGGGLKQTQWWHEWWVWVTLLRKDQKSLDKLRSLERSLVTSLERRERMMIDRIEVWPSLEGWGFLSHLSTLALLQQNPKPEMPWNDKTEWGFLCEEGPEKWSSVACFNLCKTDSWKLTSSLPCRCERVYRGQKDEHNSVSEAHHMS